MDKKAIFGGNKEAKKTQKWPRVPLPEPPETSHVGFEDFLRKKRGLGDGFFCVVSTEKDQNSVCAQRRPMRQLAFTRSVHRKTNIWRKGIKMKKVLLKQHTFMVFDVESIGLHGEGFAVAFVVVNRAGERLEEAVLACLPEKARGADKNRAWVAQNIHAIPAQFETPRELRDAFWAKWLEWKAKGAELAGECCWPVEARFLCACVDDSPEEREWPGPHPLWDIANIIGTVGEDSLAPRKRLPDELPVHDPLADSRQSARLLVEALAQAEKQRDALAQLSTQRSAAD